MPPLNVYKASAGSGKTFALTLEYLKLLFRFPGIHRHILAVTFTNKAAGEMKQRILNRLHMLAQYDGSEELEEMGHLVRKTGMDERSISMRAGELLTIILNDFSWFSVGTIDKFFQSVIRAFTREIGIQPGYNLELDHERVLSLAVDRLFQDLSDHDELQQWLIRFAEERMEESKSWNFRNDMIELGMQLFREIFQGLFLEHDLTLLDKANLDRYLEGLQNIEKDTRRTMEKIGREALDHLAQAELDIGDFRLKGNSPPSLFMKASEMREVSFTSAKLEALDQIGKWLNKDAGESMSRLTEQRLMPLYNRLYEEQKLLNTITAIRQNFYTLGILVDIWDRINLYTRERNLFLIADSNRFLRGIIGGNQVPFIYERTGNRFHHIMLDEFQDTSVFQYDNFKPLIDNALGQGHNNLVVGDVKQSIYRWRNSDWKILASDLEADFSHQAFQVHTLEYNRRSREQIIRFNNTVFQLASRKLSEVIADELSGTAVARAEVEMEVQRFRTAYADAVQQIPDSRVGTGGMVRLELFEEDEERPFDEQVLARIPLWIQEVLQAGIKPGEIAILVRTKREGIAVVNTLLEHLRDTGRNQKFRLISNESLLLVQNSSVSLILSALRFMLYPEDDLNNALFKYQCYLVGLNEESGLSTLFDTTLSMDQFLPPEFQSTIRLLKQLPLYELVESMIRIFKLDRRSQDLPYLQALQDLIIEIQRKETMGLAEFLHYWDQHGSRKSISVSEASNAIRILTIHKAKGLEFKVVMVPFCNWEITTDYKKSNILWCETAGTPFAELPVIPVRLSKNMQHTTFARAYYRERMKGYMDNLNLMYVAFTRARDLLFVGVPHHEEEALKHTGDLLWTIMDGKCEKEPALDSLGSYRSGNQISVGTLPAGTGKTVEEDTWQFTAYPVNRHGRVLQIRMRSDEYFVDEEGAFRTEQMYGNMMHLVFSRILFSRDVGPVLDQLQKEGLVPRKEREVLQERIGEMISQPGVEEWFSEDGSRDIYNERSLLCGDGKVLRPDRVIVEGDRATVVDFKFGTVERNSYREQVRNYMQHLEKVGYRQVEGFVWYVMLGRIIKIEER